MAVFCVSLIAQRCPVPRAQMALMSVAAVLATLAIVAPFRQPLCHRITSLHAPVCHILERNDDSSGGSTSCLYQYSTR